ncbi:MAG: DUF4340 domain-containing protein [Bacteroidia bacterium]
MFKKLSTGKLLIILFVLGAIVFYTNYRDSNEGESTFRTQFVTIDTASVNTVLLYPKAEQGKEIKFTKNGAKWDLQNDKIKTFAEASTVNGLINSFANLKAQSLAATSKSKWDELLVGDTSATRIKFITSDNKTYDIMVGKFGYNNETRSGTTYVRMHDEDEVYTVDGFLSFSVNQPFNSWRKRILTSGGQENWTKLTFAYPGDSSFVLSKENNQWMMADRVCDSTLAANFISSIANLNSDKFLDNYNPGLNNSLYTLNIEGNNQSPITIKAFAADSTVRFAVHSSLNSDAYFNDAQSQLAEKTFVGQNKFFVEATK